MKGYCEKDGFPREIPWLSTYDAHTIISRFNSVMLGLANFYAEYISYPSQLYRWLYIIRWSALKTLACKHHTTISKIKKIYPNYTAKVTIRLRNKSTFEKSVTLLSESECIERALNLRSKRTIQENLLKIEQGQFIFNEDNKGNPRIMDVDFLERINWVNYRTQLNLSLPCVSCGNPETEMHHVKHVRKSNQELKEIHPILWAMQIRNRRQVPLCKACHDKVHAGKYEGPPIKRGIITIENQGEYGHLYDNRIINSENRIGPKGSEYNPIIGENLEQDLQLKGWNKTN